MKRLIFLSSLIVLLAFDCTAQRIKVKLDSISNSDSTCLKEIKKAKDEIRKGKLVYCRYAGHMLYIRLRNKQEFKELLAKYGIGYKDVLYSDFIRRGQTQGCYLEYMNRAISEKFGSSFIDSLLNISDRIFLENHIDGILQDNDCDTQPIYPCKFVSTQNNLDSVIQNEIKSIKYPEKYTKRKNWDYRAYVDLHLLVDKKGNAEITEYYFYFDQTNNYKYENYLIDKIKKTIKKTNWTPATIKNKKIKSMTGVRLQLE